MSDGKTESAAESGSGQPSVLGRAGPLVLARFFTAVLTVCIPLVLARRMALAEYGTYKQLFLVAQTLYFVLSFGLPQSLYFFVPRASHPRTFFGQTMLAMTGAGLLTVALIVAGAGPLAGWFNNPELAGHRLPLALYVLGLIGSYPLEIGLTAQGRMRTAALTYLASDFTRCAAMILPVLAGFGLAGMMWAIAAHALVRFAATWWLLCRGEGPLITRAHVGEQLRYAAPFAAAVLLSCAQSYGHQFAVSAAVSPELFAIYAVGCFQLPLVDLLYSPVSEVLMVRLGEDEREGRADRGAAAFREAVAMLAFAFFPLAAFLFAAAPEFIAALFGERFLEAVPLFRVGVVGIVLAVLPVDGALRGRNQTRQIFLAYLVKGLCTVPLVIVGVRQFGMLGGIGSWAIAECIGTLAMMARLPKALSSGGVVPGWSALLPWRELGKATLAAAAAGLGVVLLRDLHGRAAIVVPEGFAQRMLPLALAGLSF
ncbi:MAG: lipopolysaccharide biosynthesis protein, partial [Myxococcales bacterium]